MIADLPPVTVDADVAAPVSVSDVADVTAPVTTNVSDLVDLGAIAADVL